MEVVFERPRGFNRHSCVLLPVSMACKCCAVFSSAEGGMMETGGGRYRDQFNGLRAVKERFRTSRRAVHVVYVG
jgi:hypothetical protein